MIIFIHDAVWSWAWFEHRVGACQCEFLYSWISSSSRKVRKSMRRFLPERNKSFSYFRVSSISSWNCRICSSAQVDRSRFSESSVVSSSVLGVVLWSLLLLLSVFLALRDLLEEFEADRLREQSFRQDEFETSAKGVGWSLDFELLLVESPEFRKTSSTSSVFALWSKRHKLRSSSAASKLFTESVSWPEWSWGRKLIAW